MSKINETNYPRRTQANYADTDMLVIQAAGGNTYTTRLEDMREDYEATLAPTLSALQDDVNENLATIEGGSTASKVYAKGDYLVFGGKLCRVTSTSIAAGATLTIGTNIELAPVGDELKTLSSDLTNKLDVGSIKSCSKASLASGNNFIAYPSGFNRDNSIIIAIAINDIAFHPIDTYLQLANMDVNSVVCSPTSAGIGTKVTFWLLKYA